MLVGGVMQVGRQVEGLYKRRGKGKQKGLYADGKEGRGRRRVYANEDRGR